MIDTLKLALEMPRVKASNALTWHYRKNAEGVAVGSPLVVARAEGGEVVANGCLYTDPGGLYTLAANKHKELSVIVSLPKYCAGGADNVYAVDKDAATAALEALEGKLEAEAGVLTDLLAARVSRVDLFANADSQFSFSEYRPLFESLEFKRQRSRDYGTTFTYGNTQRETCVYDKVAEQRDKGNPTAGLPKNLIRWEYRLMSARPVQAAVKVRTARGLLDSWDKLRPVYNANVEGALGQRVEGAAYISELIAQARYFKATYRFPLNEWLKRYGAIGLVAKAGGVENLRRVLMAVWDERFTKNAMREVRRLMEGVQLTLDFRGLEDLRRELYSKLVA